MHSGTKTSLSILALLIAAVAVLPVPVSATTGTLSITADTDLTEVHFGTIHVESDNVTLDCKGFTVTGSGSGIGISLNGRTGVTVKNCVVETFDTGFSLRSSIGNTLTGNTASGNTFDGFQLITSSSNNTLTGNAASGNVIGFHLFPSSSNNTLTGNAASGNSYGIRLFSSSNNTLTGNTASGNSYGVGLVSSSNNTLTGNTASGNVVGFRLITSSSNNTLTRNTASDNSIYGVWLVSSSGNTVFHNNIIDNSNQAVDVSPAGSNLWYHPGLEEGNFWSDYTGFDDGSGTGKHAIAGDGIGDTDIPWPGWPGSGHDEFPFMAPVRFTDVFQGNHINLVQLVQAGETLLSIPATEASYIAQGFSPRCHLELSAGELGIFLDEALFRFELSVDGTEIPLTRFVTTTRDAPGCLDGVGIRPGGYALFPVEDYLGPHTFTTTIFRDQDFDGVVDPTPLVFTLTVDFQWGVLVGEETQTTTATVQPGIQEFTFASRWAGSDVMMTLETPLGDVIDRYNVPLGVDYQRTPTSESFTITNPEPGLWIVELVGLDVPPEGEAVTLTVSGATIEARLDVLAGSVAGLADAGELNEGQGNALTSKLEGAIGKLDLGEVNTAINKFQAFINHVNSLIDEGVLSSEDGESLIGQAEGVVAELGG